MKRAVEGIVYCITNRENGKRYVGITMRSIERRFIEHLQEQSGCRVIARAIRKYGRAKFSIVKIDDAETMDDLHMKEAMHIERLGTLSPHGYNLSTRIDGKVVAHHETKNKMSAAQTARWASPGEKEKGALASRETWKRPGYRERLSLAHVGLKFSAEIKKKVSDAKKLYWSDPKNKARLAEQNSNRWNDPVFRERMSVINSETAINRERNKRKDHANP